MDKHEQNQQHPELQPDEAPMQRSQADRPDEHGLSNQELQDQQSAELPDREAMSLINANIAAPINAGLALNALSDNSTAQAVAIQNAPISETA